MALTAAVVRTRGQAASCPARHALPSRVVARIRIPATALSGKTPVMAARVLHAGSPAMEERARDHNEGGDVGLGVLHVLLPSRADAQ